MDNQRSSIVPGNRKQPPPPSPTPEIRSHTRCFQARRQLRRRDLSIDNRYTINNPDVHRNSNGEVTNWDAKLWIDNRYTINNAELQRGPDEGITIGSALLLLVNLGFDFAID